MRRAYRDESLSVAQGLALDAGREEGRLSAVVISAIALAGGGCLFEAHVLRDIATVWDVSVLDRQR